MGRSEAALVEFLADDYRRVVTALTVASGDRNAAEDAVAEAMTRVLERSRRHLSLPSDLAGWVFVAARNIERSRLRRIAKFVGGSIDKAEATQVDPAGAVTQRLSLAQALDELSRRQREVTVMHYYLDLPIRTIAESLGLSEGAVKNALFNARQGLAALLVGEQR